MNIPLQKMKPIFSAVLIGLTILVAFQVYALIGPITDTPGVQTSSSNPKSDHTRPQSKSNRFEPVKLNNVIEKVTQRNLFKVEVDGQKNKASEPMNLHLEKTSLELTLWGTVTGHKKQEGWAVIQDIETKQQDLYRVNDKIQGATIKSILRNKVILTVNGKDQILEVNADPSPLLDRNRSPADRPSRPRPPQDHRPAQKEVEDMLNAASNSNPLFKTRPYIKNGEASGVMIYSIKKDSLAQRLGLRNGDIILAVDNIEIQDPQDLEDFDESIDDSSDINISILRRGKSKKLVFSGQDNAHTINDVQR
ncbi:type II secretion system protein N [Desulfobacter postgatei]|uniref:Type II secretory pathway, component PulC n=1 Tax=Desulfobacter postgatei 2ac9 TaxID=879212 RepID=I5B2N2_9BACT|nr:type II secretory pathway, component PulC [Desulfobacter postgatei 2ac9]